MNKLEKMNIADIIDITNLYMTPQSLVEIWKDPTDNPNMAGGKSALEILEENPNIVFELMESEFDLYSFLVDHDEEIDKPRLLMMMLINYKQRLGMLAGLNVQAEEIKNIKQGMNGIKNLIKGMDRTFIFYDTDTETDRISDLIIINSKEETEGKERKNRNSNSIRLQELQTDINLGNIIQALWPSDIEFVVPIEREIGTAMRFVIEYNTVLNENGNAPEMLEKEYMTSLIETVDRNKFVVEMTRILETHIEEINMDKLLLCSAYRYIQEIEQGNIEKEDINLLKKRLETIKKHIKKNYTINIPPIGSYSLRELERDLKRFVGKENVTYISKKQEEQIIQALLTGEITLNNLGNQNVNAIFIEPSVLTRILQNNPNNYIWYLKQGKCPYNKNKIIRDIIETKKCSEHLLQLLCENTDITPEEISDLFEREIISVSDLKSVRGQAGTIITNLTLFEQYKKYKQKIDEGHDAETEKIQLERFALAYRNTELAGKTSLEIQQKGEDLITEIGEYIEPTDLIPLYKFDIIPLKIAVDWGGQRIIEELLESESLKPADARYLRNEGLLNEYVIERIFKTCSQMSYAYQVSLVYTVFDGQTLEEQKIREKLVQYYHIETGIINSSGNTYKGKRRNHRNGQDETSKNIKMRDPGAKYNLLAAIDKDVKIEEGIIDGHIIFHYPNVENGVVLIEKLHRIILNKLTGLIEIRPDNQSATYVLSEEEFIKIKSQLIQEGKVDRTQLTQRWWVTRDPEHWLPHTGTKGWEEALKGRFALDAESQRYTSEDLEKIQQLIKKSIESKKREER